jgi:hypothetical protein
MLVKLKSIIYKVAFLLLLCCTPVILNAQMKSGYRFGINLTSMAIEKNGNVISAETPVGIQFGAMYEIPLSRKFTIQSGFILSSKGTDYKIDSSRYSIAPAYIEMPVHAVYYFGRRSFKVSFFAGPYFSSAFGGYKIEPSGPLKDLTFGKSQNKDMKHLDLGFDFGTGIYYKGYNLSIQYGIGFRNVSPKNDMSMKNHVIGISIGTLLLQKRK